MNKSIIISYKEDSDDRKFNLKTLLTWLSYIQDGNTEIIIVEQDVVSRIDWVNEIKGSEYIKHIFVKNDGIFNLGWGYNIGARLSTTDILIFNSVDIIVKHLFYKNAQQLIQGCDIAKPYKTMIELDKEDTLHFVNNNYMILPNTKHVPIINMSLSNGVFIMKKDLYNMLKGFDENCYGYGYEDNIFDEKILKLELKTKFIQDTSIHLYHSVDKIGTYHYFTIANKELYNEYVALSKDDIIDKINNVTLWGDTDISKSNEISIRHIKREMYEKVTEDILTSIADKFNDDYIKDLVNNISTTIYNAISEEIKKKVEGDLKDIKYTNTKKKTLFKKIMNKFKL